MNSNLVCRICLAVGVRMLSLEPLQEAFEKITGSNLYMEKRPCMACYICHTQLRKSHTLLQTSAAAEKMLTELLYRYDELPLPSVAMLDRQALVTLSAEPTLRISVTAVLVDTDDDNEDVATKENIEDPIPRAMPIEESLPVKPIEDPIDNILEEKPNIDNIEEPEHAFWMGAMPIEEGLPVKPTEDPIDNILEEKPNIDNIEEPEHALWIEAGTQPSPVVIKELESALPQPAAAGDSDTAAPVAGDSDSDYAPAPPATKRRRRGKGNRGIMSIHEFEDKETAIKRIKSLELVTVDDRDLYVCHFCQMALVDCNLMKVHLEKHKTIKCSSCSKSFVQRLTFLSHYRIHKGLTYKCEICNKTFPIAKGLAAHIKTHSGLKPYECDTCHHKFASKFNLKKHILRHTGIYPYKCHVCGSKFRHKYSLDIHLKKHKGEIAVQCELCRKGFYSNADLRFHLKACSKSTEQRLQRPQRKRYDNKTAYKDESKTKKYACEACGYMTNISANLKRHKAVHSDEKQFECDLCKRKLKTKFSLQVHMFVHSGERPFKCDVCGRKFARKRELEQHTRLHTGEKPFECKICERKFRAKYTLDTHIRTHTGEKPFPCTICNRSFALKNTMLSHLNTHAKKGTLKKHSTKRKKVV